MTNRADRIFFGRQYPAAQQLRERKSQRAEATDPENLATGDAIAQPGTAAVNAQHRVGPCEETSTLFYQIGRGSRMNPHLDLGSCNLQTARKLSFVALPPQLGMPKSGKEQTDVAVLGGFDGVRRGEGLDDGIALFGAMPFSAD